MKLSLTKIISEILLIDIFYEKKYVVLFFRKKREMICSQYFYIIFTTNHRCQIVTGCYCWVKKIILVLNSNLNQ